MRRTHRIDFTVSHDEHAEIMQRARCSGQSVASYVRIVALSRPIPRRRDNIRAESVAALNRVGNNVNQIARVLNTTKTPTAADVVVLRGLYASISDAVARIDGEVEP